MNFSNPLVRWMFRGFTTVLIIINAALTFVFGKTYLGNAFGGGFIADWMGAFYALLIFDAAYLTWFYVYLRFAESSGQRALSGTMAGIALFGSIMATINQLAVNSFGLVDLSEYHQAVGIVALGAMLVITAMHIISTAAFVLLDPEERVKQSTININAKALEDTIKELESRIKHDMSDIVNIKAQETRGFVLHSLGFDENLHRIGQQADTNKDGRVSRAELTAFAKANPELAQELFVALSNAPRHDSVPVATAVASQVNPQPVTIEWDDNGANF